MTRTHQITVDGEKFEYDESPEIKERLYQAVSLSIQQNDKSPDTLLQTIITAIGMRRA